MKKTPTKIPFSVGQPIKTKYKPSVEGIITAVLIKESGISYECTYPGNDGLISNWLTPCEFEAIGKAETVLGFGKK